MLSGRLPARSRPAAAGQRNLSTRLSTSDRGFRALLYAGGVAILVLLVLVGTFLGYRGWQALHVAGLSFITAQSWNPGAGAFGIAAVMIGSILIALVAVVVAVPLALGSALFISLSRSMRHASPSASSSRSWTCWPRFRA